MLTPIPLPVSCERREAPGMLDVEWHEVQVPRSSGWWSSSLKPLTPLAAGGGPRLAGRWLRDIIGRMSATPKHTLTYAEYLAREATSEVKHDFINGEAFAMAGGTLEHSALAAALLGEVRAGLAGKPCRAYTSDARVYVASTGASFYPDVTVVCGKVETPVADADAIANPLVLVEVLSDSTEAYDRGAKAGHYRRIDSLREYVLVSQNEKRVEVQRRNERNVWELHFFGPGERLELVSLGVSVSVDAVYANPLQA